MYNKHDEIKKLIQASRKMMSNDSLNEEVEQIKNQYKILTEQTIDTEKESEVETGDITKKFNPANSVEDEIKFEKKSKNDKKQGFRISGGILVLHGKKQSDLELTTDEKIAFQETMDEFVNEVSELVDFNKLNLYPQNVEWSGKILDYDIEFFFSIGEENGIYINGDMIKTDDKFLEMVNKLKTYYEKFKSKWAKILAIRKKTPVTN
jgi:hypothetical protein